MASAGAKGTLSGEISFLPALSDMMNFDEMLSSWSHVNVCIPGFDAFCSLYSFVIDAVIGT